MLKRKPHHKGFQRKSYTWKRADKPLGYSGRVSGRKQGIKPGPRMKAWDRVWRWLKPRLEAAGRVRCEFEFIPHVCSSVLTPAHSKKRRLMIGMDIYTVALACSTVHRILDEVMSHEAMESAVLRAVERNGGLILPEVKAA